MSDTVETTPVATEAATPVAGPAADAPTLSITDIVNAVRVMDHMVEQGALKGWQIIQEVFGLRTRLNAFAETVIASEAAANAANAPVETNMVDAASVPVVDAPVAEPVVAAPVEVAPVVDPSMPVTNPNQPAA